MLILRWIDGQANIHWEWFDPSHSHQLFWPDRATKRALDILIAGCGTNQAAVFAFNNPDSTVLAVDVSQASLEHHQFLKTKYGLWNLELRRMPLEQVPTLGRDFDLVVATGVLHHLVDPLAGMEALSQCLRPDGVIGAMVYATYGRIGVGALESVFQDLGLMQDERSVQIVKDALAVLPPNHPVQSYLTIAPDTRSDAGLVDTFLHRRARTYTVADCLRLVHDAGLAFQGWLLQAPYYPHDLVTDGGDFYRMINALPDTTVWSVMERINTVNACHFFMACLPSRPIESYTVDFSTAGSLEYVPSMRLNCGLVENILHRPGWRMPLNTAQLAFVELIDGRRTVGDIAATVAGRSQRRDVSVAELHTFARELLQRLWRLDFLAIARSTG